MNINEKRPQQHENPQMTPEIMRNEIGFVKVDTTWGKIQPLQAAENVRTVDEIVVNKHLENKQQVIDARTEDFFAKSTLTGAVNIPHNTVVQRMDELDRSRPAIFFCNGPQCPQSSTAIKNLLEAGYPADKIWYYRGGMHDWMTMGLPVDVKK